MMNQKSHVLIAGGTGLIGSRLTTLLLEEGFHVSYLSREAKTKNGIHSYQWNPTTKILDSSALIGITHIVNLAGESIAGSRWSDSFKEKIIKSRLDASTTLLHALQTQKNNVVAIIGSSAIGIYGDRANELLFEESKIGIGFLSETVTKWEASYDHFPIRNVLLRTGIVLSKNGGALVPMATPIKFGITPILGSGKQYMSWIHIDDICNMYIHAIKNESMAGAYNAIAPSPVCHQSFMLSLRSVINKISIPIPVPTFLLNIIMGEQKAIVLDSVKASASKILKSDFNFQFTDLDNALKNIYEK